MKLQNLLVSLHGQYFRTAFEQALAARLRRKIVLPQKDAPALTVEAVHETFFFSLFGEIVSSLRQQHSLYVDQLISRSFCYGSAVRLRRFIIARLHYNFLTDWTWIRLYRTYCERIAYRSTGFLSPIKAVQIWHQAWMIWRALRSKDDLAALTVRGVAVGDLIIDSYLRFRPTPSINLKDAYLLVVIRQALKDVEKAFDYFGKQKPKVYLTTYTTYVQHGVPARVAMLLGVSVISFSNAQSFAKFLSSKEPYQTKTPKGYRKKFAGLPNQREKMAAADAALGSRIGGEIDATIFSTTTSPYLVQTKEVPDVQGAYTIFLHDFYDSVHIYSWIVFHDFWEWICFTIDTLSAANIPFLLKPHPNQTSETGLHLDRLRKIYPGLKFVPAGVTNKQLVEAGLACAVTVYGTIAAEMAYMGVPTVACGENPHVEFDFCRTARTKDEYRTFLIEARNLSADRAAMREQVCAFFYMHNLNMEPAECSLRDKLVAAITYLWFPKETPTVEGFEARMRAMTGDPGFVRFLQKVSVALTGEGEEPGAIQMEGSEHARCTAR
jgi:hypothetical protein